MRCLNEHSAATNIIAAETTSANHTSDDRLLITSDPKATKEKHIVHNVLPIATRAVIVEWMVAEFRRNGEKNIPPKSVLHFLSIFRSTLNTNLTRAS